MPKGGFRPNAPQNQFGVSGTGGNGSAKGQPVRVAPGGLYGARTASVQQQQGAPMATSAPPSAGPKPVVPAQSAAPAQPTQPVQSAQPTQPIVPLFAPTQRPNEPVTNGVKDSPGAGPEALHLPNQTQNQYNTAYDMFQSMANQPNASPAIKYLAQRIQQAF